jgi:predicted alpha/beta superfamily hydrolase
MGILFSICLLAATVSAQSMQVQAGRLDTLRFTSSYIGERTVGVWMPAQAKKGDSLAVLYMQDGQMLFDARVSWNKQEWRVDEHLDSLIGIGAIPPVMVVAIWNGGPDRHRDYFPQKPLLTLPEKEREEVMKATRPDLQPLFNGPVRSDAYLVFVDRELIPFIESRYPAKKETKDRFIIGSSMGGLISLYALCEYPQIFGGAACLSTHWPGIFTFDASNPFPEAMQQYFIQVLPKLSGRRLYFDYGTATLDEVYDPHQQRINQALEQHAPGDLIWKCEKFPGEPHSEEAWSRRFQGVVSYLVSK